MHRGNRSRWVDELAKLRKLEIAIAKFEAVLHQSNEDVKTMPPLPPRTPIQAALNFGIIPNAGHYVYRSNEAQVIDEMKKFLGTLP